MKIKARQSETKYYKHYDPRWGCYVWRKILDWDEGIHLVVVICDERYNEP